MLKDTLLYNTGACLTVKHHIHYPVFKLPHPSWQLRTINCIFKIPFKKLIQRPTKLPARRKIWDYFGERMALHPYITVSEISIRSTRALWIIPHQGSKQPVVLYLHGGAYCAGSVKSHQSYLSHFAARTQTRVITIDYRLAPEHPYPAALDDAYHAYISLLNSGYHSAQIFIAGESAGGGLALALLLKLRNDGIDLPRGCIALSPWGDLTLKGASITWNHTRDVIVPVAALPQAAFHYYHIVDPHGPTISPVYGQYHSLCPILIHVGVNEVLLSDAMTIADNIKAASGAVHLKIWSDVFHAWHYCASFLPEARQALDEVGQFINDPINCTDKL